ncbi:hypothetical protein [Herbaspirillum sp. ST 5-3]|uniref:hypothetical protein n=1 Tax=Oxalobacteraceae TaxID=75682 RepID=UPI0010A37C03|nr:hypothetical protein [Herbaspirillum sp. ST 5-3]
MRYAKTDANQTEIVEALRAADCFVQSLANVGKGCPDLLVGRDMRWFTFEVKDGSKPPSARKLTRDEQTWHDRARLFAPVHIVESVEQALAIVLGKGE